jgi:hypothetical protein
MFICYQSNTGECNIIALLVIHTIQIKNTKADLI